MLGKYAETFRMLHDATLVALASRDAERARAAGVKHGVPRVHGSYESLLEDPDIDIIVNALPNGWHCEWTVRALQAGKHVFCEKPLACSSAEVERMFAAAHTNKRWLMEGFMYRFHPQMVEAKRIIASGAIGRILHIRSNRTAQGRDRSNPRYVREAGGGALLDIGCYSVNLARFFADAEPTRAEANAHFDGQTGVDLTLCGSLHFAEGVAGHFVCSMEAEPSYPAEIIGTAGKLLIPHPWLPQAWPAELYLTRQNNTEIVRVDVPKSLEHVLAPYALELKQFCECVREGRAPQFPPDIDAERDSRANMRAIDALAESARTGCAVAVTT